MSRETQREQLHQQLREKLEQGAKPVRAVQTEFPTTGFVPPEPVSTTVPDEPLVFPATGYIPSYVPGIPTESPGSFLRGGWQDDPRWKQPGTRYEFSQEFGWVPEALIRGTGELEGDVVSSPAVQQQQRGLNLTWI